MKNRYYVYAYFRPWNGEPCYIGKGCKRRWLDHEKIGINHPNRHFAHIFRKAARLGMKVVKVKIKENLTHAEAITLEISLIRYIGRKEDGGPLVNLMGGGDGVEHSEETKKIISIKSKRSWVNNKIKIIEAQNVGRSTPEYRAERSSISKIIWSDPIRRLKSSNTKKIYYSNPDARRITSETTKAAMMRPEVRAATSAAQKKRFERPEERYKNATRNVGRKQPQEEKDRRAASMRGGKRTLKQRANMSEAQRKRRQLNPPTAVTKAKMSASAKARRIREKLEREGNTQWPPTLW